MMNCFFREYLKDHNHEHYTKKIKKSKNSQAFNC
jgi:hypothetical protein